MRTGLILANGVVGVLGGFPLPAADLVVPVVLDVRSGAARYRTDLTLTNRGSAAIDLTLVYRGSLGAASAMVTENLPAGTQRTLSDVIGFLAGRGISFPGLPDGAPHFGTLRVIAPDDDAGGLSAVARTTSPTSEPHPAGAAGLAHLVASSSASFAGRAVVDGLRDPAGTLGPRRLQCWSVVRLGARHRREWNRGWRRSRLCRRSLWRRESGGRSTGSSHRRGFGGTQHADTWEGAAFLTTASGTSAVLFAGSKGLGERLWLGFLNPAGPDHPCMAGDFVNEYTTCRTADGTPCPAEELVECAGHTSSRGWRSSRFTGRFLLYDPDDLARVSAGTMEPWAPQPHAFLDVAPHLFLNPSHGDLEDVVPGVQQRFRLGDVTAGRQNGLLDLIELFGDEARPVVHVVRVRSYEGHRRPANRFRTCRVPAALRPVSSTGVAGGPRRGERRPRPPRSSSRPPRPSGSPRAGRTSPA